RRQPMGEILDFARRLGPAPALPDAELLLAHGGAVATAARTVAQQLGKSIEYGAGRLRRRTCAFGLRNCHPRTSQTRTAKRWPLRSVVQRCVFAQASIARHA